MLRKCFASKFFHIFINADNTLQQSLAIQKVLWRLRLLPLKIIPMLRFIATSAIARAARARRAPPCALREKRMKTL